MDPVTTNSLNAGWSSMKSHISMLAIAVVLGGWAWQAVAASPVTAYDGVYAGDMDKIVSGEPSICASTSHKTLNVSNGHATISDPSDGRIGDVAPDGTLSMAGSVRIPNLTLTATLSGRFSNNGFQGISAYPKCHYQWTLSKQ